MAKAKTVAPETEVDLTPAEAARAMAEPGDWLALALDHHDQIRAAFDMARRAIPGGARIAAMKGLAVALNGHSLAEEIVLYPALLAVGGRKAGQSAYAEQTEAKIQMAQLERLSPRDAEWLAQLQLIETAVLEHMAHEEGEWFLQIKQGYPDQAKLSTRYKEEFERYTRTGIIAANGA